MGQGPARHASVSDERGIRVSPTSPARCRPGRALSHGQGCAASRREPLAHRGPHLHLVFDRLGMVGGRTGHRFADRCFGPFRTNSRSATQLAFRHLILAVSISASAWGLWRDALTDRLATAFRENDSGRAALAAGQFAEAKSHLIPPSPPTRIWGVRTKAWGCSVCASEAERVRLPGILPRDQPLSHGRSRLCLDPNEDQIAATYRYRAQVARELGQTDPAEADEMKASDKLLRSWTFSAGFFDFW